MTHATPKHGTPKAFGVPSPAVPPPQRGTSHGSGVQLRRHRPPRKTGQSRELPRVYRCKGGSTPPWRGLPTRLPMPTGSRWGSRWPSHGGCSSRPPGFGMQGEGRVRDSNPEWRRKGGSCWQKGQWWHKGKAERSLDREWLLEARPKEMVLGEKRWQRLAREEETKRKVKLERPKL